MCSWVLNYGNNDDVFFLPLLNLNPKKIKLNFFSCFYRKRMNLFTTAAFFFETEEKDGWLDSCGVINIICSCRFWLFDLIGVVVAFVY